MIRMSCGIVKDKDDLKVTVPLAAVVLGIRDEMVVELIIWYALGPHATEFLYR